MKRKRVTITQEIIDKSRRRNPTNCLLAEAVKTVLNTELYKAVIVPNFKYVEDSRFCICSADCNEHMIYESHLSRRNNMIANNFDNEWTPEPGYVIIFDLPEEVLK